MSFPISVSWQVQNAQAPLASFQSIEQTLTKLDSASTATAQKITEVADSVGQLEGPLGGVGEGVNELSGGMEGLNDSLDGSGQAMGDLATSTEEMASAVEGTGDAVGELGTGFEDMALGAEDTSAALEDMNTGLEDTGTSLEDVNTGLDDSTTTLGDFNLGLEDTVTATEDVALGMEDYNTALEDHNLALEDTMTATEDYTTALTDMGMESENSAVGLEDTAAALTNVSAETENAAMGLENTNAAMEGTAAATGQTSTSMGDMTGSLLGVAGSAVGVFSAIDNLGNKQLALDRATNQANRSQVAMDKSLLTLSKSTEKLAGDFTLGISGMNEFSAAQQAYNELVKSGVTSGAEYDSALQRLRASHGNLTSTTSEGTQAIEQLGVEMGRTDANVKKLVNDQAAADNAATSMNMAYVSLVFTIGGLSSILGDSRRAWNNTSAILKTLPAIGAGASAAFTKMGIALAGAGGIATGLVGRLGVLAKGFGALGLAARGAGAFITATMLPALGAVAVPAGVAALAIGAFVTSILAIRKHIQIFDDMGAAIGHVFPQAVGFLNELRAAFISTSDAVISSMDFILGGVDALTGGVGNMQQGFRDWVANNIDVAESSGTAGDAVGVMKDGVFEMDNTLTTSQGTFDIYNGNLKDMEGNLIALAGGWHTNAEGAIVVTKAYDENAAAALNNAASTGDLAGATLEYVPLAKDVTNASEEEAAAQTELSNVNKILKGIMDGTIGTHIQTATAMTEEEAAARDLGVALTLPAGEFEELGNQAGITVGGLKLTEDQFKRNANGSVTLTGSLDDLATSEGNVGTEANETSKILGGVKNVTDQYGLTADQATNATKNFGAVLPEAAKGAISMDDALQSATAALEKEATEAENSHRVNLVLLKMWGVDIPAGLETSKEAIQGLVDAHAEENAAIDESLTKAFEFIATHGDINDVVGLTSEQTIQYAEDLEKKIKAEEKDTDTMEKQVEASYSFNESAQTVLATLADEAVAFETAYQESLRYLELHGVKLPDALKGNKDAVIGYVDGLKQEKEETHTTVQEAAAYIAKHGDITTATDTSAAGIIKYAESLGMEAEATEDATEAGSDMESMLQSQVKQIEDNAAATQVLIDKQVAEAEAYNEAHQAVVKKAHELGVYNKIVQLSLEDAQKVVDQAQKEKDARDTVTVSLQDMARARGLENAELVESQDVLRSFIKTNDLLPPSYEEVQNAIITMIDQKQTEAQEYENTRTVLAGYIQEVYGVGTAVDATVGELTAFISALEGVANAQTTAREEIAQWMADLITSRAEEEAKIAILEDLAERFGITIPDSVERSSEALKAFFADLQDGTSAFNEMIEKLDETWDSMNKGVDEVEKLRQGFLEAGKGIRGSIDQDFEEVKNSFTGLNEHIAKSGEHATGFKNKFRNEMDNWVDNTDFSVQQIENVLGEDLVRALDNPLISDLEFAQLWMHRFGEIEGGLQNLTGDIKDFSNETVAALTPLGPEIGRILQEGFASGEGAVNQLLQVFAKLPPEIRQDLVGVTAELKAAGTDWSKATTKAMATMKAGMSPAEWNKIYEPMMAAAREAAATGDTEAQKFVTAMESLQSGTESATGKTVTSVGELGPAAQAAKQKWAFEMMIMLTAVDEFALRNQRMAITVSGAYVNMVNNIQAPLNKMAQGFNIIFSATDEFARKSQQMATTVSGSYSNMASNTAASLSKFTSQMSTAMNSVKSSANIANLAVNGLNTAIGRLQSKTVTVTALVRGLENINRLISAIGRVRSKTVTITAIYRQVIRRVYAAQGAAFITNSPMNIGPARVSEFGQPELVTVTPLQGAGAAAAPASHQPLGDLLNKEGTRKSRRLLDRDAAEEGRRGRGREGAPTMKMMRELPIIIKIGEREIANVINRRLFEDSDGLI